MIEKTFMIQDRKFVYVPTEKERMCNGCFFYDSDINCSEPDSGVPECWDNTDNRFIFKEVK